MFYNMKAIQIIDEVSKVVIGKRLVIGKVLTAILAKGHILLEDRPGWERLLWHWPSPKPWN